MANPELKVCLEDVWTLVATAVTSGQIWDKKSTVQYLDTFRDTGDAAPVDGVIAEAVRMFVDTESELIADENAIDVYVCAKGGDGLVRVDV